MGSFLCTWDFSKKQSPQRTKNIIKRKQQQNTHRYTKFNMITLFLTFLYCYTCQKLQISFLTQTFALNRHFISFFKAYYWKRFYQCLQWNLACCNKWLAFYVLFFVMNNFKTLNIFFLLKSYFWATLDVCFWFWSLVLCNWQSKFYFLIFEGETV